MKKIFTATHVLYHKHLRKRHLNGKDKEITFADRLVTITGPLIPIATIPQAYSIWVNGQVGGVSIITWSIFSLTSLSMAIYAIIHREKPLMLTYLPLIVLNVVVVIGILVKS